MKRYSFFKKHFLFPIIIIILLSGYELGLVWRYGLQFGFGKNVTLLLSLLYPVTAFLVAGIILIVRLFRKQQVKKLATYLVIQLMLSPVYIPSVLEKLSWKLNLWLYQPDREKMVKKIQQSNLDQRQKAVLDEIDRNRNNPYMMYFPNEYFNTVNIHQTDTTLKQSTAALTVERNCNGELFVEFPMEQKFFGDKYVILYSDAKPAHEWIYSTGADGKQKCLCRTRVGHYDIDELIAPKWYYVRIPDNSFSGIFSGIFSGLFGGGGGGGGSVPVTGGCR